MIVQYSTKLVVPSICRCWSRYIIQCLVVTMNPFVMRSPAHTSPYQPIPAHISPVHDIEDIVTLTDHCSQYYNIHCINWATRRSEVGELSFKSASAPLPYYWKLLDIIEISRIPGYESFHVQTRYTMYVDNHCILYLHSGSLYLAAGELRESWRWSFPFLWFIPLLSGLFIEIGHDHMIQPSRYIHTAKHQSLIQSPTEALFYSIVESHLSHICFIDKFILRRKWTVTVTFSIDIIDITDRYYRYYR